ncbi:2'-5' RNA ligase family protein [Bacillus sp. Marseille-Q1617]|uniref:2'-5' RNA ligase family protein n=1 Tax=Bacillus sp. Marseille-Q1617 TaxID=2736887 RepID=UPI00158E4795|nr:2'-5' RNA ligase family protein [Bacillus sp. Marseille-Q1617]
MKNRSICIFPEFHNVEEIEVLREKYDPLHSFIPPHITLVHPFKSNLTQHQLIEHINSCLVGIKPFEFRLQNVTGAPDHYLFLNVKKGNDSIIELRDRLYSGILEKYLVRDLSYMPHLTVGKLSTETAFHEALEDAVSLHSVFNASIYKIAVEQIAYDGNSTIESELILD